MPILISWINHPISSDGVGNVTMGEISNTIIGRVKGSFLRKAGDV